MAKINRQQANNEGSARQLVIMDATITHRNTGAGKPHGRAYNNKAKHSNTKESKAKDRHSTAN